MQNWLCPLHVSLHSCGRHCQIRDLSQEHTHTLLIRICSTQRRKQQRFPFVCHAHGDEPRPAVTFLGPTPYTLIPSLYPNTSSTQLTQWCCLLSSVSHPAGLRMRHRHFHTLVFGKKFVGTSSCVQPVYLAAWDASKACAFPPLMSCHTRREECASYKDFILESVFLWNCASVLTGECRNPQNHNSTEIPLFILGNTSFPSSIHPKYLFLINVCYMFKIYNISFPFIKDLTLLTPLLLCLLDMKVSSSK